MRGGIVGVSGILLSALAAGAEPAAVTPAAVDLTGIRVERQGGRWAGLPSATPLGADAQLFVISGDVRNLGPRRVTHVKFSYELLDEADAVLSSEYGYNFSAEALREPEFEAGRVTREALGVRPIEPGATDLFRMVFFQSEIPRFASWRVRILEVRYEEVD